MGFNQWIGMGRLTNDVDLKYANNDKGTAIARYTLAIDTGYGDKKRTDFIRCVAFGKAGEFASNYFKKGKRVLVSGNIKTGSFENKDKVKIPTFDIIVESQEFADGYDNAKPQTETSVTDGFMSIDEGEIPF